MYDSADALAMTVLPDSRYGAVGAAPELEWALAVMCGSGATGRLRREHQAGCFSLRRHSDYHQELGGEVTRRQRRDQRVHTVSLLPAYQQASPLVGASFAREESRSANPTLDPGVKR